MPDAARPVVDYARPSNADEPLQVLIIGAGFSGLCAAIRLLQKGETRFRVFEKSHRIGGTWYENSYPGAACDVPSHLYCFSFEPNPNWSRVYSPSAEIREYLEHCADKYRLRPYLEHGAKITRLELDASTGLWHAHFEDGRIRQARHVVNGAGALHKPAIPDFPGRERFAGPSMHTAQWDHSVAFRDTRVAVIGSAASAIQVVPEIAKIARKITVFQRTPNYVAPRMDRAYSAREKRRFARWPWFARFYRRLIFMRMELMLFPITRLDSRRGRIARRRLLEHMRRSVADDALWEKLTPDYALGCKRILISDDFYRALNRDNVTLVTAGIRQIEPHGVRTDDGQLHDADVLVYATGFDLEGHGLSIDVRGLEGLSLADAWSDGPEAYNGACVAGFPNYFLVTGPNTGVGTTSVVFMIEQQIGYILRLIEAAGEDRIVSVSPDAQASYNRYIHAQLDHTVWASGCKSWYRRADGKITTLYPNNARAFRRQLAEVRWSDFVFLTPPRSRPARALTASLDADHCPVNP